MAQPSSPSDDFRLNYFNYFTEVEEHFVRRRGKHLLVSTLDWAIIETWKDMGIPLHLVLRAIDRVFDAYEAQPVKTRLINSVLYCQQEVMTSFAEYKHARVGAPVAAEASPEKTAAPFSREAISEYLETGRRALERAAASYDAVAFARFHEAVERVLPRLDALIADVRSAEPLDFEALERELTRLETILYDALVECLPAAEIEEIRTEGKNQLKEYRRKMEESLYEHTLANYVAKRLREKYAIPRLSLFYL
jgi:hypothetical protein